jgi:hypothetical protein
MLSRRPGMGEFPWFRQPRVRFESCVLRGRRPMPTWALTHGPYNDFEFPAREVIVRFCALFWLVPWFVAVSAQPVVSQDSSRSFGPGSSLQQKPPNPADEARLRMEREMAKKANQARQVELKRDTEKLLKLATELKEYVDKTSENTLSVDVVRKAEEIEKLAHSVKGKMKGSY